VLHVPRVLYKCARLDTSTRGGGRCGEAVGLEAGTGRIQVALRADRLHGRGRARSRPPPALPPGPRADQQTAELLDRHPDGRPDARIALRELTLDPALRAQHRRRLRATPTNEIVPLGRTPDRPPPARRANEIAGDASPVPSRASSTSPPRSTCVPTAAARSWLLLTTTSRCTRPDWPSIGCEYTGHPENRDLGWRLRLQDGGCSSTRRHVSSTGFPVPPLLLLLRDFNGYPLRARQRITVSSVPEPVSPLAATPSSGRRRLTESFPLTTTTSTTA